MTPVARALIFLVVLLCETGCDPKARLSDESEREHPAIRKGREFESAGDYEGARFTYQALLDRDPSIARAHLALAFLMEKQGSNSVDAIYHFQRYLALRPDTEKRRMIQEHIRSAQLYYVSTVFSNQSAVLRRLGELERENASATIHASNLDAQITQLRATITALRGGRDAAAFEPSPKPDTGNPPARPAGRVVKVGKGDSLRVIALRYYGDPERWHEIYEANRDELKHPQSLQVGQSLIVPDRHRRQRGLEPD